MSMRVAITGGTGTLGRALIPVLESRNYGIVVFSRSEKSQLDLRAAHPDVAFYVGDVLDRPFLRRVLAGTDAVVHAAALKHVDISEREPTEYVRVNVQGSANVAAVCRELRISRLLGISTDKACEPYNVYGMTKLIMERMFVEQGFSCVRYGNVLGSVGSVLEKWLSQARGGVPLTITDATMTRFYFPVSAAAELVLRWIAGELPGPVYVPYLRATTIGDLAAAARRVFGGCGVTVLGNRPGEKHHEQLVSEREASSASGDSFGAWFPTGPGGVAHSHESETAPRIGGADLMAWVEEWITART